MKANHKHVYERVLIRQEGRLHLVHKCQLCGKERELSVREHLSQLGKWLTSYEDFTEVYGPLPIIER